MTAKNKLFIVLVLSILAQIGFIYFLIIPSYFSIKSTISDLIVEKSKSNKLELDLKNIKDFISLTQKEKDFLTKIDRMFVNKEEPIEFLDYIEGNLQKYTSEYEISDGGSLEDELGEFIFLNISFNSSYINLLKLLHTFQNSDYLMSVESLSVNAGDNKESLSSELKLKVYIK